MHRARHFTLVGLEYEKFYTALLHIHYVIMFYITNVCHIFVIIILYCTAIFLSLGKFSKGHTHTYIYINYTFSLDIFYAVCPLIKLRLCLNVCVWECVCGNVCVSV